MNRSPARTSKSAPAVAAAILCALSLAPAAVSAAEALAAGVKVAPPLGGVPRPLKLPPIRDSKLPNGLLLRVVEDHRFPLVTMRLVLPFGTTADPAGAPGLCEATADLLQEGTVTRTSRQIADELASIGGSIDASSGPDTVTLSGSALSEFTPRLAALLADEAMHPSFPEAEVALRRANMKQELAQNRAQPSWLARERFAREIYGRSPYAITSATDASIGRLDRAAIAAFHHRMFTPASAVLVVVGDVDAAAVARTIGGSLAGWVGEASSKPPSPVQPEASVRRIVLVDRPGSVQSDVVVGGLGIRRTDPLYFPALMMDGVIGGGTASRLFLVLREEKGYTYDAHSEFRTRLLAGDWSAVTEVRTEVTKPAIEEMIRQLDRVRAEDVGEAELASAKSFAIGLFTLQVERAATLAGLLAEQTIYDLPPGELETYVSKISAVTPADVRRAAASLCDTSKGAIVVVGDASKVRSDLGTFGSLAVYDSEGKPQPAAP
jgi:predicted Zn-dependent peptidase